MTADPPRGSAKHPPPPADRRELEGFPKARTGKKSFYRAHVARKIGSDGGCWWFASISPGQDPDEAGRFDLPHPRGTCYAGSTSEVAVRERLGTVLCRVNDKEAVAEGALSTPDGPVVVSKINLGPVALADITHRDAQRWNVNRALSCGGGIYVITQAWAAAFDAADFGGIRYAPRFTLGNVHAVALFGPAGAPKTAMPVTETKHVRKILSDLGVRIVSPPGRRPHVLSPNATPPVL